MQKAINASNHRDFEISMGKSGEEKVKWSLKNSLQFEHTSAPMQKAHEKHGWRKRYTNFVLTLPLAVELGSRDMWHCGNAI